MEAKELYKELLWRKGEERQMLKCCEECNELCVAIHHYINKHKHNDEAKGEVITELADVQIMLEQMIAIYGEEEVAKERERKLQRQIERMARE